MGVFLEILWDILVIFEILASWGYFDYLELETWWIFWIFQEGFCYFADFERYFRYFQVFFFFLGGISVSFKDFKRYYCQFGDLELFWSIWRFINIFVKDFNVIWVGLGLGPMLPCTKLKLCQYWDVIPWIKIFTN